VTEKSRENQRKEHRSKEQKVKTKSEELPKKEE
jgi:hypothetical protein